MSDNTKKGVIAILIVLIAAIGIYSYFNNKKQTETINTLTTEKEEVIAELEKMEAQYNEEISKNTVLTSDLETQKKVISKFKDSIKKLKNTNWSTIKFYKNKIKNLTKTTNRLFASNDSLVKINKFLNEENESLSQEKDSLTQNLTLQTKANDTLFERNKNLTEKIAVAQKIRANGYKIETFDKRGSGKFKTTDKARRVNTFKVSFFINENPLAKDKDLETYVVLKNKDNNIINSKGFFTNNDGKRIAFTEKTIIPFKKSTIATDIILNVDNIKLEKGDYFVDIYINNRKMKTLKTILK